MSPIFLEYTKTKWSPLASSDSGKLFSQWVCPLCASACLFSIPAPWIPSYPLFKAPLSVPGQLHRLPWGVLQHTHTHCIDKTALLGPRAFVWGASSSRSSSILWLDSGLLTFAVHLYLVWKHKQYGQGGKKKKGRFICFQKSDWCL